MANSQDLESMKLPELKELAKQMGLRGTSTMRKPELIATLQAARSGGQAPAGVTVRAPKGTKTSKDAETAAQIATSSTESEPIAASADISDAPIVPAESAADASVAASDDVDARAQDAADLVAAAVETVSESADGAESEALRRRTRRKSEAADSRRTARRKNADGEAPRRKSRKQDDIADDLLASLDLGEGDGGDRASRRTRREEPVEPIIRRVRNDEGDQERRRDEDRDDNVRDLDDILATLPTQKHVEPAEGEDNGEEREFVRRNRNRGDRADRDTHNDRSDRADRRGRRVRGRDANGEDDRRRDDHEARAERADRDARREEPAEDLVPVAGIIDVLDSYAFVRTSGYLPGPNDVYVSMGQVKKYGLRKGDAVHGSIRAPREGDRRNQRQKFVPLQSIDSINGQSVEESLNRPQFSKLTPLYPQERLKQETVPNKLTGRIMDIVAPIGKGQRGLIVSPPKAGKTITLQNIANAIATNNPEVHLMVVLVDERPEEVTDMERTVQGEVISSTFDRPASDHTTVAELAIERAKRLVELGQDVVVLLDSMTRLARAYNIAAPASGRILSGGVDAQALYPPKKFFGAARNIENGGSLTIISSALVETGSKMDEVIFEEFKGTGNMELRLSRELADKRLFPAIDINASGTRREELITNPQELPIIYRLRRLLGGMEPEQAYQTLVPRLKKTATNRDFLAAIVQQANTGNATNGN
ncbi:transcription termination factor Rho [Bifidobacterium scaligerum]|uniref:Transcription termination factor Rho n=1 Tax=Bifidobacterium scaligerum TaxID=2052656 RepID=A0A2M9HQ59_9BIFI|nr:transcription termination factor Rho [Bifidobacterium scaligerum]PJM78946.1 transcription termination factor Rho [Bifidobacterium scaligerum]